MEEVMKIADNHPLLCHRRKNHCRMDKLPYPYQRQGTHIPTGCTFVNDDHVPQGFTNSHKAVTAH